MKKFVFITCIIISLLSISCLAAYDLPKYSENKTPIGLANFALNAYNIGQGYAKGYYSQIITTDNLSMYSDLYPDYYTTSMITDLQSNIEAGQRMSDCVGLIKGYMWQSSDTEITVNTNFYPDWNATTLFENTEKKGSIKTLPDIPGVIVYDINTPHVGVYVGNGMVVDNRTYEQGTIYSRVEDYTWTHWLMLNQLDYDNYQESINNTSLLFGRQLNTFETIFGWLPSDILAALIVITVFIFALGIARIVL